MRKHGRKPSLGAQGGVESHRIPNFWKGLAVWKALLRETLLLRSAGNRLIWTGSRAAHAQRPATVLSIHCPTWLTWWKSIEKSRWQSRSWSPQNLMVQTTATTILSIDYYSDPGHNIAWWSRPPLRMYYQLIIIATLVTKYLDDPDHRYDCNYPLLQRHWSQHGLMIQTTATNVLSIDYYSDPGHNVAWWSRPPLRL